MKPIAAVQPPPRPMSGLGGPPPGREINGPSGENENFVGLLSQQVQRVNTMQTDANDMIHTMLTGGDVNEAEVLTAVQKADLAFRMLLQVRNKMIEAYREIQQIQI